MKSPEAPTCQYGDAFCAWLS